MNNLDLFSASELKKGGISVAMAHAELKHDGWAEAAMQHFYTFLQVRTTPFLCEEVRLYAETYGLPKAPSNRAWGGIILNAKKIGWIRHLGYSQVKNPRAHMANASLWVGV